MAHLVICCDGTWNSRRNKDGNAPAPTNVVKIHAAVCQDRDVPGAEQLSYYREGVGTTGGWLRRLWGGAFGYGLTEDIESACKWLAEHYRSGDRIYLFGFSRGAYTVRSLAGALGAVGLPDLTDADLPDRVKWDLVKRAIRNYRNRKLGRFPKPGDGWPPDGGVACHAPEAVPVHFLGVWDTVGALGVPDDWALVQQVLTNHRGNLFHDTNLGENVKIARHAVGLDERRVDFSPTLWTNVEGGQHPGDVQQRWFVGVHGDVGGSYADRGLGDLTLAWMMAEARRAGLRFRPGAFDRLQGDPRGALHDSVVGAFRNRQTRPRAVPDLGLDHAERDVHASVYDRRARPAISEPAYWRSRRLELGESQTVYISAKEHWARTGLYLSTGCRYRFRAEGEWLDASIRASADGPVSLLQAGTWAYGLAGISEGFRGIYRRITQNPYAENLMFRWGRRQPDLPWFSLVGVVANGAGVDETTKRRTPHETVAIGAGMDDFSPGRGGYLYCYANDSWSKYRNNRGRVRLRVTRTG